MSRRRHSYSSTSRPPSRITSLHVTSLCLNRCSRMPGKRVGASNGGVEALRRSPTFGHPLPRIRIFPFSYTHNPLHTPLASPYRPRKVRYCRWVRSASQARRPISSYRVQCRQRHPGRRDGGKESRVPCAVLSDESRVVKIIFNSIYQQIYFAHR